MNRFSAVTILLISFSFLIYAEAGDSYRAKEQLAVFDFETTSLTPEEIRLFTDQIGAYIAETGKYVLVERNKREQIMQEQNFSLSGLSDEKTALELGKMLTAHLILVGNIGNIGTERYWINIKMIDVSTGESIRSVSQEYRSLAKLLDDTRNLIYAFIEPETYNAGEYLIITPGDYSKFDLLGLGYSFFHLSYEDGTAFQSGSLALSWIGIRGRRPGIFWDFNYYIPVHAREHGISLSLSDYSFVYGLSFSAGLSSIFEVSDHLNLITGIGVHHEQNQYWLSSKAFGSLTMTFGAVMPVYILLRMNTKHFIGIAGDFYYDFVSVDFEEEGHQDGMGFDLRVFFGNAK